MSREMRTLAQATLEICGKSPTPERVRAAEAVAELTKALKGAGWEEKSWNPGPNTPLAVRTPYGWDWCDRLQWIDHPYRLVNKRTHEERFVSEPYDLYGAWDDFARLDKEDWDVTVSASLVLHFPGSTVAVIIQRKKERAKNPESAPCAV